VNRGRQAVLSARVLFWVDCITITTGGRLDGWKKSPARDGISSLYGENLFFHAIHDEAAPGDAHTLAMHRVTTITLPPGLHLGILQNQPLQRTITWMLEGSSCDS